MKQRLKPGSPTLAVRSAGVSVFPVHMQKTGGETEAWNGEVVCPRSLSRAGTGSRSPESQFRLYPHLSPTHPGTVFVQIFQRRIPV